MARRTRRAVQYGDDRPVQFCGTGVTFDAHLLETGTQSDRLRTSKTTTRRKRAS